MQVTTQQIEGLVTWTLIRSAHQVQRALSRLFAEHGLNPVQFGVLAHLSTEQPMTQAELARAVLVRPQSMAEVIDGLVERGLLVRTGRRGRGRRNPVTLSDAGGDLLERVWPAVEAANDLSGIGLTAEQTATLNSQLHALRRATDGT